MRGAIRPTLGGTAVVCCVHDREQRVLSNPDEVIKLGRESGIEFDPRKHKIHSCACCKNLFVALDDIPKFCGICSGVPIHKLEAAMPKPRGVFDG